MTQNKNARITTSFTDSGMRVETSYRDFGTLETAIDVRFRNDVESGRSLAGMSLKTAGGRHIRLNGHEARTLFRALEQAVGN